jgi:hypothetical protein
MSVEAYIVVFDVWKRVKPYIRDILRGELGKARVPKLVVVHDIPFSKNGERVVAYYDKRRNEIVVSAKYIDELLHGKYGEKDLKCAIVHIIFHELKHFIDCKKHGRCNDEEGAEMIALEYRVLCYADLIN